MGLAIAGLALRNWRNIVAREMSLDPELTMLVGSNATGKTNTIEALALLTQGRGFRHARAADQLREGAEMARIALRLEGDGRLVETAMVIEDGRRRFTRNGKALRPLDVAGTLLSVLFTPDDLLMVKGPASQRRDELDAFGEQVSGGYRSVARTYRRSIAQRNRLLKEESLDGGLLDAWDESVALGAATLLHHRLSLFSKLKPLVEEAYGAIAPGEVLEARYEASLKELRGDESREELKVRFLDALRAVRGEEVRRGMSLVGPHRDDVAFLVGGRDARSFASQGQQRTIVLAWKIAQVRFCETTLDARPVLLLDDVMSELDEHRRNALSSLVESGIQTIITTTHLGYFEDEVIARAKVVEFGG